MFLQRRITKFKAWAAEHAIRFEPLDGATADSEKLTVLDKALEGKRIVYLGESDHYIHELYEFRLLFTRYLFSRGWRWIGEELGVSDGVRIDQYHATGDEAHLHRIPSFGYRGASRTDRDDTPTGILKDAWGPSFPQAAMKAEQIALARQLRQFSEHREPGTDRLRFFGFDIDGNPGGGYEDIGSLLASAHDDTVACDLRALLTRVAGESIDDEIARLGRAIFFIESNHSYLESILGKEAAQQLPQSVLALRESFVFLRDIQPVTEWEALNPALAVREEGMFRRLSHALSRLGPTEKVILQSHAGHLSKDWPAARTPGGKPPPASVGTRIHQAFPDEVFAIWMVNGQGCDAQPYPSLSSDLRLRPGTLNAILAEVGSCFLLPTRDTDSRADLLARKMGVSWIYNNVVRTAVARQADALFFVREVTPLKEHLAPT